MEQPQPVKPSVTRYRQLDSLRGLGALSVFLAHFISLKMALPLLDTLHQTPLGILCNGTAALMLFFVLSGFVLSLPFVRNERPLKFGEFYIKRVFRIYPAYIFAIILAVLLKQFVFDKNGLTPYSNWLNNFWNWNWDKDSPKEILKTLLLIGPDFKINYIDPPIWSLVIEMKMSIILPFFILIVSHGSKTLNIGFLLVMAWLTYEHNAWAISVFYLGILMAKYKDEVLGFIQSRRTVTVTVLIILALLLYNNNYELLGPIKRLNLPSKYILSYFLSAIGSCVILITVLGRPAASRFFQKRIFTFFGDISYSFYLVHVPLILTVGSLISNRFAYSPVYIFFVAFIAAVVLSYLMSVYVEQPFQRLAVRLVKKYQLGTAGAGR
jgi:peptidoglycan/LPS O-acetylase OafA/YrhL